MSLSIVHPPTPRKGRPPGAVFRRFTSVLVALMLLTGSVLFGAAPAQAGSVGIGYQGDSGFIGAYIHGY